MSTRKSDLKSNPKSVFPGDEVKLEGKHQVRLGNGLVQDKSNRIVSTRYGIVRKTNGNRLWVDNYQVKHNVEKISCATFSLPIQKRYLANVGDWVLGVVCTVQFHLNASDPTY